jgi:putative tributyrin esterase
MRALPFILLAACAGGSSTPATPEPPPSPGTMLTERFHSEALGVDKTFLVWLPPGYKESTERFPVVYLLHGLGGNETNWSKLGVAEAAEQVGLRALIVMPDGDDGFYVDWPGPVDHDACLKSKRPFGEAADMATYCVKTPRYEAYIVGDLVKHVDATYRTVAERRGRAIAGLSMGGYGALYLGLAHRDQFVAAASHAGVASLLYRGPHPYRKGAEELSTDPKPFLAQAGQFGALFRAVLGEDIANWRAHDPGTLVASLKDGELALYIDAGTEDEFQLDDHNQYLHDLLTAAGITHSWTLIEGGRHDKTFWTSRIDDSLAFIKAAFSQP